MIEDLRAQGVKQIDALFISHAHGDHYGGLSKVCKAFPVKWLYLPDPPENLRIQLPSSRLEIRQERPEAESGEGRSTLLFHCG